MPTMPESTRSGPCLWCDSPREKCGAQGTWMMGSLNDRLRAYGRTATPGELTGLMYIDAHMEDLYGQARRLSREFYRQPNELLLPLCAPREIALMHRPHRVFGLKIDVIITSEVRVPTLRYLERH